MITQDTFTELKKISDQPCVSLYVPMVVAGNYEKNRINWKNACLEALKRLEKITDKAAEIMQPAFDREDDKDFWANQSQCLAGFYTEGMYKEVNLTSVNHNNVSIHSDFFLNPLIKEVNHTKRLFVLALSKNQTKFYEAVKDGIYPIHIQDKVVVNMDEALNIDEDDTSLQSHSAGGDAIYHGNDAAEDKDNIRLKQYFRRVDDGLMQIIHDEKVPLILAAVEEYHPMYKDVTNYNFFSDHMITGNPEHMTPQQIHDNLIPVFKEIEYKRRSEFLESFGLKRSQDLTAESFENVKEAAQHQNIDTLLVSDVYYNTLDDSKKEELDDIMMKAYTNGATILWTSDTDTEFKAVLRFAMQLDS